MPLRFRIVFTEAGFKGTGLHIMDEIEKGVTTRLRRIEGQVQGIQRMLESGRDCEEVLTQIMAVRSSLDQVGLVLMERHIEKCLVDDLPVDAVAADQISAVLKSWVRFGLVPGARADLSDARREEPARSESPA